MLNQPDRAGRAAEQAGPPFSRSTEHPESLAGYIGRLVDLNPAGEIHEIDRFGRRSSTTYGALFRRAGEVRDRLAGQVPDENRVAIIAVNGAIEYVSTAWACLLAGVDFLPFDTSLSLTNPGEFTGRLSAMVEALGEPLVLADRDIRRAVERSGTKIPVAMIDVQEVGPAGPDIKTSAEPAASRASNLLISTSGTGGDPKIAIIDNSSAVNRFFDGYRQDQRACLYSMAHHSVAGVRLLLPLGRRVVYLHPLRLAADPAEWVRTVGDHAITDVGMSSSLAAMLCTAIPKGDKFDHGLRLLERISFGAEVIVPHVVDRLLSGLSGRIADNCVVSLVYSMTETGPLYRSTLSMSDLLRKLASRDEPIALDHCVAGWRVRCVDESGRVVPEGQSGTVQVFSKSKLFAGYRGEGKRADDGWFDTGDVAVMSEGKLTLKGREKSTIVVNARKITCEEIETRLAASEALGHLGVIAAPYRNGDQVTDEVAVFFTLPDDAHITAAEAASLIVATVSRHFGLSVKHCVPVRAADIERTSTMKIKRDALVEKYRQGELGRVAASAEIASDDQEILELWQQALDLPARPGMGSSFFDLGGDSLAAARLMASVESVFAVRVDADEFFDDPTPQRLVGLIARAGPGQRRREQAEAAAGRSAQMLESVASYVSSWQGERLLKGSLLVGFNTAGTRPPIFWVFQSHAEAAGLAQALGPDRPLYALRSASGILPTAEYSEDALRSLLDRYLWEILAVSRQTPFSLGGNCQGGIIALLLAKQLTAIGRSPHPLFLLEWAFDYGRYAGPVEVLLGRGNPMWSGLDEADLSRHLGQFFPSVRLRMTPGSHGEFFSPQTVGHLAARLEEALPRPSSRFGARVLRQIAAWRRWRAA